MTDPTSESSPATDTWEGMLAEMRRRYPGQKDSVLFCILKLQQNPDLSLRDFRDEARLYGIPMAGRALHSARVMLGLQTATAKPARQTDDAEDFAAADREQPSKRLTTSTLPLRTNLTDATTGRMRKAHRAAEHDATESIENQVLDAVRQIQSAASQHGSRLREAMRRAVQILQEALDE